MRPLLPLLALAALLAQPTAARAATFYVDDGAAASPPSCTTAANPCKTIGDAVGQARAAGGADVVEVAPGTYPEPVTADQPGDAGLTIDGAGDGPDPSAATVVAPVAVPGGSIVTLGGAAAGGLTLRDVRVVHQAVLNDKNGVAVVGASSTVAGVTVSMEDVVTLGTGFSVTRGPALLDRVAVQGTWNGNGVNAIGSTPFAVTVRDARIAAGTNPAALSVGSYASVRVSGSVLRRPGANGSTILVEGPPGRRA